MKYMHFKASCSYTALAAMMEYHGTDTEDYRIALEMKLPWLFAGEDGAFISGPMLQGAKWFDLWLAPRGYRMEEERVSRDKLCCEKRQLPVCPLPVQFPLPGCFSRTTVLKMTSF